jgi:hypothetical protein
MFPYMISRVLCPLTEKRGQYANGPAFVADKSNIFQRMHRPFRNAMDVWRNRAELQKVELDPEYRRLKLMADPRKGGYRNPLAHTAYNTVVNPGHVPGQPYIGVGPHGGQGVRDQFLGSLATIASPFLGPIAMPIGRQLTRPIVSRALGVYGMYHGVKDYKRNAASAARYASLGMPVEARLARIGQASDVALMALGATTLGHAKWLSRLPGVKKLLALRVLSRAAPASRLSGLARNAGITAAVMVPSMGAGVGLANDMNPHVQAKAQELEYMRAVQDLLQPKGVTIPQRKGFSQAWKALEDQGVDVESLLASALPQTAADRAANYSKGFDADEYFVPGAAQPKPEPQTTSGPLFGIAGKHYGVGAATGLTGYALARMLLPKHSQGKTMNAKQKASAMAAERRRRMLAAAIGLGSAGLGMGASIAGSKTAQYTAFNDSMQGVTLHDVYRAINQDTSLSMFEQRQVMSQLAGVTRGASPDTPVSALMSRGLGGVIGYLISKYFGMGTVGKLVSTAAGYGLGKVVYDQFNSPPSNDPPGWRIM